MMPVNNDFSTNPWPRCGEIDIMEEVGYNPNYTSSSIHCDSYNHVKGTQKTAERYTTGALRTISTCTASNGLKTTSAPT